MFDKTNKRILTTLVAAVMLLTAVPVLAHKFFVSAWVEEGKVFIEAAFGDGSLAHNAEVVVFDPEGKQLLTTATDEQGTCSFKIPQRTALRVKVKAGMGHQDEVLVPLDEIESAFAGGKAPGLETKHAGGPGAQAESSSSREVLTGITAGEIQAIVDKALDKKLRPIVRKLASKDDGGPTFKDIAGAIGYILGLVGIGTYFNYRRKRA